MLSLGQKKKKKVKGRKRKRRPCFSSEDVGGGSCVSGWGEISGQVCGEEALENRLRFMKLFLFCGQQTRVF